RFVPGPQRGLLSIERERPVLPGPQRGLLSIERERPVVPGPQRGLLSIERERPVVPGPQRGLLSIEPRVSCRPRTPAGSPIDRTASRDTINALSRVLLD